MLRGLKSSSPLGPLVSAKGLPVYPSYHKAPGLRQGPASWRVFGSKPSARAGLDEWRTSISKQPLLHPCTDLGSASTKQKSFADVDKRAHRSPGPWLAGLHRPVARGPGAGPGFENKSCCQRDLLGVLRLVCRPCTPITTPVDPRLLILVPR